MSLLQLVFFLSGIVVLYVGLDVARRQKFNALHFLVFIGTGVGLLVFTAFPRALDLVGRIFGIPRGADALVYGAIVFLVYFVLVLLGKSEKNREDVTSLGRAIAIMGAYVPGVSAHRVAVVVPAYKEEKVIATTLEGLAAKGFSRIVVVDDGSPDGTSVVARAFAETHPGTVVLRHPRNRGQGAALETGFEYLRRNADGWEFAGTYDADGQHDPDDLLKMAAYLEAHPDVDVTLGSRFLHGASVGVPWKRRVLLHLGVLFTFFVSRLKLTDTHNGLRMIRRRALGQLCLTQDGMAHASEIIDLVAQRGLRHAELPVNILYTEYSMAKGQKGINAINIALKMIWHKISK